MGQWLGISRSANVSRGNIMMVVVNCPVHLCRFHFLVNSLPHAVVRADLLSCIHTFFLSAIYPFILLCTLLSILPVSAIHSHFYPSIHPLTHASMHACIHPFFFPLFLPFLPFLFQPSMYACKLTNQPTNTPIP